MVKLKAAILAAQTLGELHALMEDYSYMEFMQVYNQLTLEQQAKIDAIDERDSKAQMLAINVAKTPVVEGKQSLSLTESRGSWLLVIGCLLFVRKYSSSNN